MQLHETRNCTTITTERSARSDVKSTSDLWAEIRRALPGPEEMAAEVAAELGESHDDVRLSVLIGTIALDGQLGPEGAATAAITTELARLQAGQEQRAATSLLGVASL